MVEKKLHNIKKSKKQDKILILYQSIVEISLIINLLRKYSFGECILVIT